MKPLIPVALAALVGVVSLFSARDAEARPLVGVRAGQYADIGDSEVDEPFVGVEVIAGITRHVYFNPNAEYVFVDEATFGTGNLDFHLDLPVADKVHLWMGAGLAAVYVDPDGPVESDTDLGLNLLAGIGFQAGAVIPYVQGKLVLVDETDILVLAVGVRF